MSAVGDVIQPGQPIPDDVTGVDDAMGDDWHLTSAGHWHCGEMGVKRCAEEKDCASGLGDPLAYARLTVTAVREPEQPMPRLSTFPEETQHWTDDADGDPAIAVREQPAEPKSTPCPDRLPHEAHEHSGFARRGLTPPAQCPGVRPAEPQQADASPVLDLVQQHASEWAKAALARRRNAHDEASAAIRRSQALLDRIAALVPQQPVQARTTSGDLIWQHIPCGWASPWHPESKPDTGPDGDPVGCHNPGSWRPLLVGGDPAPEPTHDDFKRLAGIKRDLHEPHVDGPREPSAHERADHDLVTALGVEQLDEVIPAIEHLKARVDHLRNWRSEHDKRERERDEARAEVGRYQRLLKSQASNFAAAQPDPLVLSLSAIEPPRGTVALVGKSTRVRYAREATSPVTWRGEGYRDAFSLLEVFQDSGPELEVELAPPREPRTWPALKPGPDPVDLPQYVTVEGWGSYGLREDGLYANTDGYADDVWRGHCLTFAALRALGDVTEVTE